MSDLKDLPRKESISLWPLWVAIGFPLLLVALEASPVAPDFLFVMMGVPALFCAWSAVAVWAAILTVRRLRKRVAASGGERHFAIGGSGRGVALHRIHPLL